MFATIAPEDKKARKASTYAWHSLYISEYSYSLHAESIHLPRSTKTRPYRSLERDMH